MKFMILKAIPERLVSGGSTPKVGETVEGREHFYNGEHWVKTTDGREFPSVFTYTMTTVKLSKRFVAKWSAYYADNGSPWDDCRSYDLAVDFCNEATIRTTDAWPQAMVEALIPNFHPITNCRLGAAA